MQTRSGNIEKREAKLLPLVEDGNKNWRFRELYWKMLAFLDWLPLNLSCINEHFLIIV